MPFRISYERMKGHRQVVGKDPDAIANGWGNTFANFKTKAAAKKYLKLYPFVYKGKKAKIYHVKGKD